MVFEGAWVTVYQEQSHQTYNYIHNNIKAYI